MSNQIAMRTEKAPRREIYRHKVYETITTKNTKFRQQIQVAYNAYATRRKEKKEEASILNTLN